jgi:hypothetical protein
MNQPQELETENVGRVASNAGLGDLYQWMVHFSKTSKTGDNISCEIWDATIYAKDETEARKIFAEQQPGKTLDKIVRGQLIDDA